MYPSFLIYTALFATEAIVGLPLLAALIAVSYWSLARPALVAVTFLAAMTPWWVHSARLHGRFVPLDTTGGLNLLIGNSPDATGTWRWTEVSRLSTGQLQGVDPTTPDGSDHATRLAVAHVRAHPSEIFRLMPARIAGLLAIEGREQAYLYSFGYFGSRSAPVVWAWGIAVVGAFPLLLGSAALGCAVRRGVAESVLAPCVVLLAASLVMHLASFGDPRFHLPLMPVLTVLATGLARRPSGVVRWRLAAALVLLLGLTIPWSTQLARSWTMLTRLVAPDGSSAHLQFDDLL